MLSEQAGLSYGELVHAILSWKEHNEVGIRAHQIVAERRLTALAATLESAGYHLTNELERV